MRQKIVAGNWKMYKTRSEARAFINAFLPLIDPTLSGRTIVLCAPFTCLDILSEYTDSFAVGAQNVHWGKCGAFTGEIAPPMLIELGVQYAIVGHSERREYFNETDYSVNQRLRAAQEHGLIPILCVGESEQERAEGRTESKIATQLEAGLQCVELDRLVIAYEPIWAIGTGLTCESSEANRIIGFIRAQIGNSHVPILYGGSVKPSNIDEIMAKPEIDGALVGGASLEPESFAGIVNYQVVARL